MKTHTRITTLLSLVGLLAYMLTATSCTGLLTPERQAKIDQASQKYESTTGITSTQTLGLLGKWWSDYTAARQANAAAEILRTQADPATDWTSAKQVLQGIQPQALINSLPEQPDAEAAPAPSATLPSSHDSESPRRARPARPSRHDPPQALAAR